ncbi:MAG: SET domain-containing protein-lysine N-methyltransferase [Saprospiraceae bacterium]
MQRIPSLFTAPSDISGGCFTGEPIEESGLIEICPVDRKKEAADHPRHDAARLLFRWGDDQRSNVPLHSATESICTAISYEPNAKYLLDYDHQTIDFYAIKNIEPGEEILVNYNGEAHLQGRVWFDDQEKMRHE